MEEIGCKWQAFFLSLKQQEEQTMCQIFFFFLLYTKLNGEDSGTPLQYSCLENSMDGGAW